MSNRMLEIPFEVADGVTVACLSEQYEYLQSEQEQLEKLIESGEIQDHQGADYVSNKRMMAHIKAVLRYCGTDVEENVFSGQ